MGEVLESGRTAVYILSKKTLTQHRHGLYRLVRYAMNQTYTSSAPSIQTQSVHKRISASKALFFAAAGISFFLSIWLWFSGDRERGLFVGLWVPSILSAGGLLLTGGRHE